MTDLPLIDGPRERLSSPGAIEGRLAPASDCRPANDGRLLAPPIDTLAKLAREAIALGTTSQAAELAFEFERGVGELKSDLRRGGNSPSRRSQTCRPSAGPHAQLKTAYFSLPQPPARQRRGQVSGLACTIFRLRGRLRAVHVHVICMYLFLDSPRKNGGEGEYKTTGHGSTRTRQ